MFEFTPAELVGYAASALVVLSLTMTSVVRLRTISLMGSTTFVVYGALIGSVPILVTNASIALINIWFLRSELGLHRDLGALQVAPDSAFLVDFLEHHLNEIHRFQPDFVMPDQDAVALLLMRDGLPAGALIGRRDGRSLDVVLDFVVAAYRDSRLGRWLYGPGAGVLRDLGVERVVSTAGTSTHRSYLERIGFRAEAGRYVLDLV